MSSALEQHGGQEAETTSGKRAGAAQPGWQQRTASRQCSGGGGRRVYTHLRKSTIMRLLMMENQCTWSSVASR